MFEWQKLVNQSASEWSGLRLPVRNRLAAACRHLLSEKKLQLADIMRMSEVSRPQASLDIRLIMNRAPGLMEYDRASKCYRLLVKKPA